MESNLQFFTIGENTKILIDPQKIIIIQGSSENSAGLGFFQILLGLIAFLGMLFKEWLLALLAVPLSALGFILLTKYVKVEFDFNRRTIQRWFMIINKVVFKYRVITFTSPSLLIVKTVIDGESGYTLYLEEKSNSIIELNSQRTAEALIKAITSQSDFFSIKMVD